MNAKKIDSIWNMNKVCRNVSLRVYSFCSIHGIVGQPFQPSIVTLLSICKYVCFRKNKSSQLWWLYIARAISRLEKNNTLFPTFSNFCFDFLIERKKNIVSGNNRFFFNKTDLCCREKFTWTSAHWQKHRLTIILLGACNEIRYYCCITNWTSFLFYRSICVLFSIILGFYLL